MNKKDFDFLKRITAVAQELPLSTIENLCDLLAELPSDFSKEKRLQISQNFAPINCRDIVVGLLNYWCEKSPDVTPINLAWALRSAGKMDELHKTSHSAELVWTGPAPENNTFRRTDQALLELIDGAQSTITLVTFAAYKVPEIAAALLRAAERGVNIILILESPIESEGKIAFSALKALGHSLAELASIYIWPIEKRQKDESGRHGSLHVKCAIADESRILISSANLTDYAFNLNMELGVLMQWKNISAQVADHVNNLIKKAIIVQIN